MITVALLVLAGGCSEAAPAPSPYPAVQHEDPAPPVRDAEACEQIQLQYDNNQRLHADGYADDYGDRYEAMLQAAGC